jgi:hypothetical protein
MLSQVLHALEALQVSVGLSWPYTVTEGKLADECHREADDISFFACHNRCCLLFRVQIYNNIFIFARVFGGKSLFIGLLGGSIY